MSLLLEHVDKTYLTKPYRYTEADAMIASSVQPLHQRKRQPLIDATNKALQAVGYGTPAVEDWRVLADAVNIVESLLDMQAFDDPGGLFTDMVNAVAAMGRLHGNGKAMRLNAVQLSDLTEFVEAYEQVLAQVSARTYIRAHRATERRLRKLIVEGVGRDDYEFLAV